MQQDGGTQPSLGAWGVASQLQRRMYRGMCWGTCRAFQGCQRTVHTCSTCRQRHMRTQVHMWTKRGGRHQHEENRANKCRAYRRRTTNTNEPNSSQQIHKEHMSTRRNKIMLNTPTRDTKIANSRQKGVEDSYGTHTAHTRRGREARAVRTRTREQGRQPAHVEPCGGAQGPRATPPH